MLAEHNIKIIISHTYIGFSKFHVKVKFTKVGVCTEEFFSYLQMTNLKVEDFTNGLTDIKSVNTKIFFKIILNLFINFLNIGYHLTIE